MKKSSTRLLFLAAPVAAICLGVSGLVAADATSAEDPLAGRVTMVHTLLFDSSAAQQIETSGDEAALAKRREAIALFERAAQGGDRETREAQLNEAVATLYEAVSLVRKGAGGEEKGRHDFDNRKESLEALLAAHARIMDEKGTPEKHAALLAEIEADASEADRLRAGGDIGEARSHLDRAYEKTMLSVEHSRTGETLTRELKFDSPEDEYRYELDRNDTHRMLVTILLEEKLKNEKVRDRVAGFIETADELRRTASKHADAKRFDEAIDALELSTGELVKAIRSAGVYIPG